MIPRFLRLVSLFLTLTFASEQILFALPGEGSFLFSSPTGGYGSGLAREERSGILTQFSSPQNPYIGASLGLPKPSSLKQAGWFKKLFKKIARFFQKVVQAVTKAIQKVVSFIAKAVGAVFGKSIGNFVGKLAGGLLNLIASPVLIFANTFAYAFSGDIKGLFKYWGSMAIQIAVTALMFIPGVGQLLYGALQFILQPIFAIGKFLIGGFLQGLGIAFSGMGSFLGGFSTGIGSLFSGTGIALRSLGQSLVQGAKSFFQTGLKDLFQNLKLQSFSLKKLFDSSLQALKNQLNPVTYYKNLWKSVTESFHQLTKQTGLTKLLTTVTEKLTLQLAQSQIDKQLEKSKMNSFLKGILSSVSTAGIQAIGQSISQGFISPILNQISESLGFRGPPANTQGRILRYDPKDEARYLLGADGKTREIYFGGEPIDFTKPFEQGRGITFGYSTDENGIPSFARFFGTGFGGKIPEIQYGVDSRNPDRISFQTDSGDLYESTRDLSTQRYRAPRAVTNLPEIRRATGPTTPFNPKDPNFDFVKFLKDRYGLDGGALPKLGALLGDVGKADKLHKIQAAIEGGVRFELREGGKYVVQLGKNEALDVLETQGRRFLATNSKIASIINAEASVGKFFSSKTGALFSGGLTVFDDVATGIYERQSVERIIANATVDGAIAVGAGLAGAFAGGVAGAVFLNPAIAIGANLVFTEIARGILTAAANRIHAKEQVNNFLTSFNRQKERVFDRDQELMAEAFRRDFTKRYAFFL